MKQNFFCCTTPKKKRNGKGVTPKRNFICVTIMHHLKTEIRKWEKSQQIRNVSLRKLFNEMILSGGGKSRNMILDNIEMRPVMLNASDSGSSDARVLVIESLGDTAVRKTLLLSNDTLVPASITKAYARISETSSKTTMQSTTASSEDPQQSLASRA